MTSAFRLFCFQISSNLPSEFFSDINLTMSLPPKSKQNKTKQFIELKLPKHSPTKPRMKQTLLKIVFKTLDSCGPINCFGMTFSICVLCSSVVKFSLCPESVYAALLLLLMIDFAYQESFFSHLYLLTFYLLFRIQLKCYLLLKIYLIPSDMNLLPSSRFLGLNL